MCKEPGMGISGRVGPDEFSSFDRYDELSAAITNTMSLVVVRLKKHNREKREIKSYQYTATTDISEPAPTSVCEHLEASESVFGWDLIATVGAFL